eukprot:SM000108S14238  [mRNA]  locus=s108:407063:414651:- [translate_table: standard]
MESEGEGEGEAGGPLAGASWERQHRAWLCGQQHEAAEEAAEEEILSAAASPAAMERQREEPEDEPAARRAGPPASEVEAGAAAEEAAGLLRRVRELAMARDSAEGAAGRVARRDQRDDGDDDDGGGGVGGEDVNNGARQNAFRRLRPLCVAVVEARGGAAPQLAALRRLAAALQELPRPGLRACMDYVLFPLHLLVAQAGASRRTAKGAVPEISGVADSVVEEALHALEILLGHCSAQSGHQLATLLRALASLASLPREAASEEIRLRAVRCLRLLLLRLACHCPAPESGRARAQSGREAAAELSTCPVEALRSVAMAPAVGHLFSLLLQVASGEVAVGSRGSRTLRSEALATLHQVILQVRTADALAFFLPGVASGLAKALLSQVAAAPAAPAASSSSICTALKAFTDLLVIVCNDDLRRHDAGQEEPRSAQDVLHLLRGFSKSNAVKEGKDAGSKPSQGDRTTLKEGGNGVMDTSRGGVLPRLRIERTAEWLEDVDKKVHSFIAKTFTKDCLLGLSLDGHHSVVMAVKQQLSSAVILETVGPGRTASDGMVIQLKSLKGTICRTCPSSIFALQLLSTYPAGELFSGAMAQVFEFSTRPSLIADVTAPSVLVHARAIDSSSTSTMAVALSGPPTLLPSRFILQDREVECNPALQGRDLDSSQLHARLRHLEDEELFWALAHVCRVAGSICGQASLTGSALSAILEPFLRTLRTCANSLSGQPRKLLTVLDVAPSDHLKGKVREVGSTQRAAASAALVIEEIIYGASGVWREESEGSDDLVKLGAGEIADVLPFVEEVLHEFVNPDLWDLPYSDDSLDPASARHALDANILLHQILLRGVAVFARALGRRFVSPGTLLASTLYPVLDKLGDTYGPVSEAAGIALHSICINCGYPSPRALVAANADYIVDSLCRGLRHLAVYPRTPRLFVAVLSRTKSSVNLLPLLSEPIMREIAAAAHIEAAAAARQSAEAASSMMRLKVEADGGGVLAGQASAVNDSRVHAHSTASTSATLEDEYCTRQGPRRRSSKRSEERQQSSMEVSELAEREEGGDQAFVDLSEAQAKREERLRLHRSLASVATSCLEACGPLLGSKPLSVLLVALDTAENAVRALGSLQACRDSEKLEKAAVVELIQCGAYCEGSGGQAGGEWTSSSREYWEEEEGRPAAIKEEEMHRILPRIHLLWPHLVLCLRSSSPTVLARALEVMSTLALSGGGDFVARRFRDDAWPHMLRLLCHGPVSPAAASAAATLLPIVEPFPGEQPPSSFGARLDEPESKATLMPKKRSAPSPQVALATVLKVKEAVLRCIATTASESKSSTALAPIAKAVACAIIPLLRGAVHTVAKQALLAIASIDSDTVWLLLADLTCWPLSAAEIPGPQLCSTNVAAMADQVLQSGEEQCSFELPDKELLLPSWSSSKDALYILWGKGQLPSGAMPDVALAVSLLSEVEHLGECEFANPIVQSSER